MKMVRAVCVGGWLFGLALGVSLFSGCSDSPQDGGQAKVDPAAQEQHNKKMMEYMQNKKAAPKS